MVTLALFASGSGTNVENIVRHFDKNPEIKIVGIFSNNSKAYVLERAGKLGIPAFVFSRHEFYETDRMIELLQTCDAGWIILAGFLWMIPENIIARYPNRIVNIHPALLPKYGGKGMYGMRVHQTVIENGDTESGITIHRVNSEYDRGDIIFQSRCPVLPGDTAETLAQRVHKLEYEFYPRIIEKLVLMRHPAELGD
jgi:phosphoribosylglycinamide formyltransferase 1